MFYLGILATTVADTISSAIATNPRNQTPDAATDDTPEHPGDFDCRQVCGTSSDTSSICNHLPDSQSLPPQTLSLGQRTMLSLPVDNTITDTPSSEETGHDAAASGSAEAAVAIDTSESSGETTEAAAINDTSELPGETTEAAATDDTYEPPAPTSDIPAPFGISDEDIGAMLTNDGLVSDDEVINEFPPPSAPPEYYELYPYQALRSLPEYEPTYNIDPTNITRAEAYENTKNPVTDDIEGACALPPVTEKPISLEDFNNTYYYACRDGDLNTIKRLEQAYPQLMIDPLKVPEEPKKSVYPLHLAANLNHVEVVEFLCQNPCIDINALSADKSTALLYAIDKNHVATVKFLCQHPDIKINLENNRGLTPIICACKNNVDDQIIDALLDHKPYLGENKNNKTALSFSVENNNLETTEKLLKSGAVVNKKNKDGKDSIFYISFDKASDEISKLLLDYLPDVNQSLSDYDVRVLHLAALQGKVEIASYLILTRKASRFVTNKYKSMPVHYAAYGNHASTLRRLIDLGCTLYEGKGRIEKDFWELIKYKYSSNYDINYKRINRTNGRKLYDEGGTPLDYFGGDAVQLKEHEEKYGRTREAINKEKQKDRNLMKRLQENIKEQQGLKERAKKLTKKETDLENQIQKLRRAQNEKTTGTVAATGATPSTPPVSEQPIPSSDLSALAYTHQSGYEAMQDEWARYDVDGNRLPPATPFTGSFDYPSAHSHPLPQWLRGNAQPIVPGTPITTIEANENIENTGMDDARGASAMPAIMEPLLSQEEFNNMYFNACQAGDIDTLKYLKQAQPELMIDSLQDPENPDNLVHPLHLAALNNQWKTLEFLCTLDGININARMSNGNTVLKLVVREKMQDTILFLCQQPGINVNFSDYPHSKTPIISACELNLSDQVIDALLALKPYLGPNKYKKTALGFSVKNHNLKTTEKLLDAGAAVDRVEENGMDSVFYISFTEGTEEMSILLLRNLPNVDKAITKNGACVLHLASLTGKHALIPYLINDLGASKFIENKNHAMPVHYAAHNDNTQTLRVLIEHGCTLQEGPGKIEDEFWPMKQGAIYAGGFRLRPEIDYDRYNKSNGKVLHSHGGTPSEFYGGLDKTQLENFERLQKINIKEEKKKDKKSMEEKQKQEKNKQKLLKQEKQKQEKDKLKLQQLEKQKQKLQAKGQKLQAKEQKNIRQWRENEVST
ncbi:ankyrin repeat domain-containing protein [Endozoicomonas sp. YOMI1]|uniref:ankyrin repeat domain-containing protein n=1 Tax=Endozoicomonas sp. YOMI1 TaxID=2828739 RepID=UPI002148C743|nr:ankyrin repeat domain-containing protein [Endozoicomonas sp. YOMI1]